MSEDRKQHSKPMGQYKIDRRENEAENVLKK